MLRNPFTGVPAQAREAVRGNVEDPLEPPYPASCRLPSFRGTVELLHTYDCIALKMAFVSCDIYKTNECHILYVNK